MVALEVLRSPWIEARADALELAHHAVDEQYAAALTAGLRALLPRLADVTDLHAACVALIAGVELAGARGLTETPLAGWVGADPPAQAAQHAAALLLSGPSDPLIAGLAGALGTGALGGGGSPYAETVAYALIDTAERLSDLRPVDAARAELRALVETVAESPRERRINARSAAVRNGQDLHDIAEVVYGDRDRTGELIASLRLYPPYLSATPQEGRLAPGDRILLPPDPKDLEAEGLGFTLALSVTGNPRGGQDWDLIDEGGTGLASDRGLQAFATDLALRLATPLGSLSGEPNYGVTPVAGLPANQAGVYAAVVAAETLREDERVERVIVNPEGTSTLTGVFVGGVVAVPRPELIGG